MLTQPAPLASLLSTTDAAPPNRGQRAATRGVLPQLHATLEGVLADRGGFGSIAAMGLARKSADSSDKYLVRDLAGRAAAMLSLSPTDRPNATEVAARSTLDAQAALGKELGRVVLTPWHTGWVNDGSSALHRITAP